MSAGSKSHSKPVTFDVSPPPKWQQQQQQQHGRRHGVDWG